MQYHPCVIILFSVLLLVTTYKKNKTFKLITRLYPILALTLIFISTGKVQIIHILGLNIEIHYNFNNNLISCALLAATFAANSYALVKNKKSEIIIGGLYCAFTHLYLFAGDYVSLFIGLESMMIFASLLFIINDNIRSLKAAKKYFITHLFSSSLILVGICYSITLNSSISIQPVLFGELNPNQIIIFSLMLTGFLINIGAFPFSGWVISCYPSASGSSFTYLISFTTKISLVVLIKIFAHLEALKYIGILLVINSVFLSIFEHNLRRLLCYVSLNSAGFILININAGTEFLFEYIFIDILYKALIGLLLILLEDKEIMLISDLQKLSSFRLPKLMKSCVILGVSMIINLPFITNLSFLKHSITHPLEDNFIYIITAFNTIMVYVILNLVFHVRQVNPKRQLFNLNSNLKFALYFMLILILTYNFISLPYEQISFSNFYMLKQSVLITATGIFAYFIKPLDRFNTKKFNLDFLKLMYEFFEYVYLNPDVKSAPTEKTQKVESGINTLRDYAVQNQQTAIFVVFLLLIVGLLL